MENEELPPRNVSKDELISDLIEDGPLLQQKKITLRLRILGFIMILLSFGVLMLWRNGMAASTFRTVALGMGIAGFVIYFSSRVVEIAYPKLRKRKHV